VPPDAVERAVEAEALPHPGHDPAEDLDIAAGVMATDSLLVDLQARHEVVE
jgi:hypothetical protein